MCKMFLFIISKISINQEGKIIPLIIKHQDMDTRLDSDQYTTLTVI